MIIRGISQPESRVIEVMPLCKPDPTYKIRPLTPDKPLCLWGVRDFL